MTPVTLVLPTRLLRRFRELAAVLLPNEDEPFHALLRCAAAEAMTVHAAEAPVDGPPATLVPVLTVHSAVPVEAARFVARIATASGLTLAATWHQVVLEFCERSEAPGIDVPEMHVYEEVA